MAKSSAAKSTTTESTALATTEQASALAELFGDDDLGFTGLESVEGKDRRLAVRVWNMKGIDKASGDPIQPNTFFDSVTETTKKRISLVVLDIHKSHLWSEFDAATDKTVKHCRSYDRVTGRLADGTERPCRSGGPGTKIDCPDFQWVRGADGKNTRRCGEVWNVAATDLETQEPFVARFKKTSTKPLTDYLNRHFLGKLVRGGRRSDVPLFAFETQASLVMHESGKYAIPVLELGRIMTRAEYEQHRENALAYHELFVDSKNLEELDRADRSHDDGSAPDTSFDVDAMDAAPPTTKGANHF